MANKDDYLTEYRVFFENFAQTLDPNDQLPVKLASYKLVNQEVVGAIIDWTLQYLTQKNCPPHLLSPLIKIIIEEVRQACRKQPVSFGFVPVDNVYEPLKLMQTVMAKTNAICSRYLDNSVLCSLPSPGAPYNIVSMNAIKNVRRKMEDRYVAIHDLNTMFNLQKESPSSYYAVFDGHAGYEAAAYSAAHLHQFLAESEYFPTNAHQALFEAFSKTDSLFVDKCNMNNLRSGTTAVCALLLPKEKTLYIAWVGDSQAFLYKNGYWTSCVNPHRPNREDEKIRIEEQGGYVVYWGTWRVNGQLAVTRAIGDPKYKPFVTAVPEIKEISLDGNEDFLIIACDGLWDFVGPWQAKEAVYNFVCKNPDEAQYASHHLVEVAKAYRSSDNISVIVVFLKDPHKIAEAGVPYVPNLTDRYLNMENNENDAICFESKESEANGFYGEVENDLLNLTDALNKQNGGDISTKEDYFKDIKNANSKRSASDFNDDDENFDSKSTGKVVDNVDATSYIDAFATPAAATAAENGNNHEKFDPFIDEPEKGNFETDAEIRKLNEDGEFDPLTCTARDETPTPPIDSVHDAGLIEAIADSESEDEDEWNYVRGEEANKDNRDLISPKPDIDQASDLAELMLNDSAADKMSQLNPDAAEFVPGSPSRNAMSPICNRLLNEDRVISQSPIKPGPEIMDNINVPNALDFDNEIKSKPSEIEPEQFSNGHQNGDDAELNGVIYDSNKENNTGSDVNISVSKLANDEFHFGPNAAPFTPHKVLDQSEVSSTRAVFGDESVATLSTTLNTSFNDSCVSENLNNKEADPMSMSFYQEKDEANPFDLDAVHTLPEDVDKFIQEETNSFINTTISDLPEHFPLGNVEKTKNNDLVTDLDLKDEGKEIASPVDDKVDFEIKDNENYKQQTADLLGDFCEYTSNKAYQEVEEHILSEPPSAEHGLEEFKSEGELFPHDVKLESDLGQQENVPLEMNLLNIEDEKPLSEETKLQENDECDKINNPFVEPLEVKDDSNLLKLENEISLGNEDVTSSVKDDLSSLRDDLSNKEDALSDRNPSPVVDETHNLAQPIELLEDEIKEFETDNEIIVKPEITPVITNRKELVCELPPEPIEENRSQEGTDTNQLTSIVDQVSSYVSQIQENVSAPDINAFGDSTLYYPEVPYSCPFPRSSEPATNQVFDDVTHDAIDETHPLYRCIYPLPTEFANNQVIAEVTHEIEDQTNSSCVNDYNIIADVDHNLIADLDRLENKVPANVPASPELIIPSPEPKAATPVDELEIIKEDPVLSPIPPAAVIDDTQTVEEEVIQSKEITETIQELPQETPQEVLPTSEAELVVESDKVIIPTAVEGPSEKVSITPIAGAASVGVVGMAVAAAADKRAAKAKTALVPTKKPTATKSAVPPIKPMPRTTKPATTTLPARPALTKTTVAPLSAKPSTNKPTPSVSATKTTTAAVPKVSLTKPKSSSSTLPPKITEKKSLTNGETKQATSKTSLTGKKPESAVTKTTSSRTLAATKNPSKPLIPPIKTAVATPRTLPAAKLNSPLSKAPSSARTATSPAKTTTIGQTASSPRAPISARPRPATAPFRPKVPSTSTTKPLAGPDTEKLQKESTNKLTKTNSLSATKMATSTTSKNVATTGTVRQTQVKTSAARTTLAKTSSTTVKTAATTKKSLEVTKPVSKTRITKVEKAQENGIATVITEQITTTVVNNGLNAAMNGIDDTSLIKDNSPVDNKLIVDALVETNID